MSRFLSLRKGEVKDLDNFLANKLIEDGLASEYNLIEPTGKITITENGSDIDVAQYAKADVNVSGGATPNSLLTISSNTSAWSGMYVGTLNGEIAMISFSEPGELNTFQGLYGTIYPKVPASQTKVALSDLVNCRFAEVALGDGEVGNARGVVFWTTDETASFTVTIESL